MRRYCGISKLWCSMAQFLRVAVNMGLAQFKNCDTMSYIFCSRLAQVSYICIKHICNIYSKRNCTNIDKYSICLCPDSILYIDIYRWQCPHYFIMIYQKQHIYAHISSDWINYIHRCCWTSLLANAFTNFLLRFHQVALKREGSGSWPGSRWCIPQRRQNEVQRGNRSSNIITNHHSIWKMDLSLWSIWSFYRNIPNIPVGVLLVLQKGNDMEKQNQRPKMAQGANWKVEESTMRAKQLVRGGSCRLCKYSTYRSGWWVLICQILQKANFLGCNTATSWYCFFESWSKPVMIGNRMVRRHQSVCLQCVFFFFFSPPCLWDCLLQPSSWENTGKWETKAPVRKRSAISKPKIQVSTFYLPDMTWISLTESPQAKNKTTLLELWSSISISLAMIKCQTVPMVK